MHLLVATHVSFLSLINHHLFGTNVPLALYRHSPLPSLSISTATTTTIWAGGKFQNSIICTAIPAGKRPSSLVVIYIKARTLCLQEDSLFIIGGEARAVLLHRKVALLTKNSIQQRSVYNRRYWIVIVKEFWVAKLICCEWLSGCNRLYSIKSSFMFPKNALFFQISTENFPFLYVDSSTSIFFLNFYCHFAKNY